MGLGKWQCHENRLYLATTTPRLRLDAALDYIKVETDSQRNELIQIFKDNKLAVLPDGRKAEDMVRSRSQISYLIELDINV